MFTKGIFNVEQLIHRICRATSNALSFKTFAEEADPPAATASAADDSASQTPPPAQQQLNYEDLIARARKEEKDKLYPRVRKAEEDLAKQVNINNELLLKNATLQNEVEALKKSAGKDPRVGELEKENETLKQKVAELEAAAPNEEAIRKKVEEEYAVKMYAEQKKAELEKAGSVLPSFLESIAGDTKEAVDTAATAAINSTLQIKKDLGLVDENGNPVAQSTPAGASTSTAAAGTSAAAAGTSAATTGNVAAPSVNPTDGGGINSYSAEYIRGLDPASEEYRQLRKKLGFK